MRRSSSETSLRQPGRPAPSVATWLSQWRRGLRRRRPVQSAPSSEGGGTPPAASFADYVRAEMKTERGRVSFAADDHVTTDGPVFLPFPRRKLRLKFVQIDSRGGCVDRVATRHEILSEVRQNWEGGGRERVWRRMSGDGVGVEMFEVGRRKDRRGGGGNRLTARDMRQIDPAFTATCAIWVREDAMVVSLEGVRAIILDNKMLVFDPDNEKVQPPIWYIRKRLMNDRVDVFMPFEFAALEGVLIHACLVLETDFLRIEPELRRTLGSLPKYINNEQLERLRLLEQRLNHYYARAKRVQNALQSLLDEDEDMADMYLTEKKRKPSMVRNPVDHDEAEMLLETYLQTIDDLTGKAGLLNRAIDDTENLIEIHLDTMQNRLLLVDLLITVITTTLSFGTMVTSIFGMNFPLPDVMNSLPSSKFYFLGTIISMLLVMSIGLVILVRWCRRQGIYRGRPGVSRRKSKEQGVAVRASVEKIKQAEEVLNQPHRKVATSLGSKEWDGLPT